MATKFNKDMYAKMRSKKDEPLSNIGKRTVHVTGKGPSATPAALVSPTVLGTENDEDSFSGHFCRRGPYSYFQKVALGR